MPKAVIAKASSYEQDGKVRIPGVPLCNLPGIVAQRQRGTPESLEAPQADTRSHTKMRVSPGAITFPAPRSP